MNLFDYLDVSSEGEVTLPSGKKTFGYTDAYGYKYITPKIEGKRYNLKVHKLVALKYIPNVDKKPCINHIDCNKENNCVDNLEWCTHSENMRHAHSHGLLKTVFKRGDNQKHSDSDLEWIRDLYKTGDFSMRKLASLFNTSSGYISEIVNLKWRV